MIRTTVLALACGVSIAASVGAVGAPQANGSITGTVKVAGQSSGGDAVVYLLLAAALPKAPAGQAVLDQKNMKFAPHVLAVPVGTTVSFKNSDTVAHNVFSPDFEKYNLGTFGPGLSKEHTFSKCAKFPCAYTQLCMIHPEMEGFIVVVPDAYSATTNDAGQFAIQGVPPGQYQVAVWHPKGKGQPKAVTVEAGKAATVDFALSK
ncbi:MAG: carboxypeptidase regulatory-like domain-containing protein [Bacteroidales bacterium]